MLLGDEQEHTYGKADAKGSSRGPPSVIPAEDVTRRRPSQQIVILTRETLTLTGTIFVTAVDVRLGDSKSCCT